MSIEETATEASAPTARSFRFGWADWLCVAFCVLFLAQVVFLIYRDSVDESAVSNRSFAAPALGLAGTLATYAAYCFRSRPVFVRVFGWLTVTFVLYLGFGLAFILLNAFVGEFLR